MHTNKSTSLVDEKTLENQRQLLTKFGYTIQSHFVGTHGEGWWALLPGEKEFFDNAGEPHKQNYSGFFNSETDLLEEVSGFIEIKRSEEIKTEYLSSGCQASDATDSINKLMGECASLFESDQHAWEFLIKETHID
jgi:hypothetical protein